MARLGLSLKLILWVQLALRGMWGSLFRYYGTLALWSGLLLAGTLGELFLYAPDPPVSHPGRRLLVPLCFAMVSMGYLLGRLAGKPALIIIGVVVAAVFVISPRGDFNVQTNEETNEVIAVFTDDPGLFIKGLVGCGVTLLLPVGLLRLLKHRARQMAGRTLLRSIVVRALILTAPVALELIRISARLPLPIPIRLPWERWLQSFFLEPGWPYALAIAAWLGVSYLWVDYDSRILPHLLHRVGIDWQGEYLTLCDAHLVDRMLRRLPSVEASGTGRS